MRASCMSWSPPPAIMKIRACQFRSYHEQVYCSGRERQPGLDKMHMLHQGCPSAAVTPSFGFEAFK